MKTLVAGIGNVFFGDDGFGVEVAHRLGLQDWGIRGVHLAYELLDDWDALVLIDALPVGEVPGTVVVFEPDLDRLEAAPSVDAHSMSPAIVLATLRRLGGRMPHVVVVGCQPESIDERLGLSDVVAAAVEPAAAAVRDVVTDLEARQSITPHQEVTTSC